MGSWTITKWELKNTLHNRKFILIFFLQLVVLLMMVLFFSSFMEGIESEEGISLTPSLNQFASLDIYDPQNVLINQLNPEILEINSNEIDVALSRLEGGDVTGVVLLPSADDFNLEEIKPVPVKLYIDYKDPKRSVIKDEVVAAGNRASDLISQRWIDELAPQQEVSQPQIQEETQGEALPLQLINKVMTAILLFLPLFLFGNLIVDSIVGEKERKTGEILIAMPVSRSNIILGKSTAVIITMALQVALWMVLMILAGYSIENPGLVYLIVVTTALPIVGLTSIIAAFSKNYKEAGIGITFAYVAIIGFLIVPALAYISQQGRYVSTSTMTLTIKVFSGEPLSPGDIIVPFTSLLLISLISYYITIWLFKRDDIVFGPRPGLLRLLYEFTALNKVVNYFKK